MMRKAVSMGNLTSYNSASPQPCMPEQSESGDRHGYVSDSLLQKSGSLRERKKGVPWTEDEHRMFLDGLQKLGKGDWRGISRSFVPNRTPTQVASHAQKHFLRQSNLNKSKRRSSLFDIISTNTVPLNNTSSAATVELNPTSPKMSFNLAARVAPIKPVIATRKCAVVNINSLGSDCATISADLCLGCAHSLPQRSWPHTFSSTQQADVSRSQASSGTSDCTRLLPPSLSFMSHGAVSDRGIARPSESMLTTSSTLTKLCRIDEATDQSANLRLTIGPSAILLEPMELSLKIEQPVPTRHSTAMVGTNTNSSIFTNAIRVV